MKRVLFLFVIAAGLAMSACGGAKDCDCPSFSKAPVETPAKQ